MNFSRATKYYSSLLQVLKRAGRKLLSPPRELYNLLNDSINREYLASYNEYIAHCDLSQTEDGRSCLSTEGFTLVQSGRQQCSDRLAFYRVYFGTSRAARICWTLLDKGEGSSYFISNNRSILNQARLFGYVPIYIPILCTDNPLISSFQAKIFKCNPFYSDAISSHRTAIYLDAKVNFDLTRLTRFLHYGKCDIHESGRFALQVFRHPWSESVLAEFYEAMIQDRYRMISDKIKNYIDERIAKIPTSSPLVQTGLVVYHLDCIATKDLCNAWMSGILAGGFECQIILDLLLPDFDCWQILPESLRGDDLEPRRKVWF